MLQKNDNGQAAKEFYEMRRTWRDHLCVHTGISDRAYRVGCFIAMKSNGDDQCMWFSLRRFEDELGMSKSKLLRALKELDDAGFIIIERSHRKSSRYHIRLPQYLR